MRVTIVSTFFVDYINKKNRTEEQQPIVDNLNNRLIINASTNILYRLFFIL